MGAEVGPGGKKEEWGNFMVKKTDILTALALLCVCVLRLQNQVPQSWGRGLKTSAMSPPTVRRPEAQSPGIPGLPPSNGSRGESFLPLLGPGAPGRSWLWPHHSNLLSRPHVASPPCAAVSTSPCCPKDASHNESGLTSCNVTSSSPDDIGKAPVSKYRFRTRGTLFWRTQFHP